MKVGIVGPIESTERIKRILEKNFDNTEIFSYVYKKYHEAPDLVERNQDKVDGLIFTGKTPFKLTSMNTTPKKPWDYIPRHGSSILTVFVRASTLFGYDITNVSIDCFDKNLLIESYGEIGIKKDKLNIHVSDERILEDDYLDYLYSFHKNNYLSNKVSCCITGLVDVYKRLNSENIPSFKINQTANIVKERFKRLQLKHMANINTKSQIVVISIGIDLPAEQSFLMKDEYMQSIKRMKAMEQIYLFAQRIQGAVVEVSPKNILIFSTRSILQSETNNLQNIELMNYDRKNSSISISMGIGYGRTAREAKQGAVMGMEKSRKAFGGKVFVGYNGETVMGPIINEENKEKKEKRVDEKFLLIAENTGLSINTVFKINSIMNQYNQNEFTSSELSRLYGVTERSMNRVLNKLENGGYLKVCGKKVISTAGRPSRIIKIMF